MTLYQKVIAVFGMLRNSIAQKASKSDVASEFSSSATYKVNQGVMYNGLLYRCTAAHTGAWNEAHFTRDNIDDIIDKKIEASESDHVQANWTETDSGSPAFIKNKPTIPTKTSDITNDSGFITDSSLPYVVTDDYGSMSSIHLSGRRVTHVPSVENWPDGITVYLPSITNDKSLDVILRIDSAGSTHQMEFHSGTSISNTVHFIYDDALGDDNWTHLKYGYVHVFMFTYLGNTAPGEELWLVGRVIRPSSDI